MRVNSADIVLFFILILCNSLYCSSQSQPIFKKIDQSNGLSNGRVSCVVKEAGGYIWIGTTNGLNRYDGKEFVVYNKQNSSISSNDISDLLIDNKNRIWVATFGGGLNLYNAHKDTFVTFKKEDENGILSNEVYTIFEDSSFNLWFGTKNGLSFYDERQNRFINYRHQRNDNQSIGYNDVRSITEDQNGNLWLGTMGGGLNKFNIKQKKFEYIKSLAGVTSDYIYSIQSIGNKLLIGTNGAGLLVLDMKSLEFSKVELLPNDPVNIIRRIMKDSYGAIWVCTDGSGLFKIENINLSKSKILNYRYSSKLESSISSNSIYDIIEDENSNLWIGTAWNGINVLSQEDNHALLIGTENNEPPSSVLAVYKGKDYLLGLDGKGLSVVHNNGKIKKRYSKLHEKYIGADYIQYIKKGGNETYWIGTFINGLVNFNPETESFIGYRYKVNDTQSLSYNDVRYITEDDHSNLWIATWGGGLNHLNTSTKTFTRYKSIESDSLSLSSNNIISMQKDAEDLWLGTFGGGVNLFNTKTKEVKRYMYSDSNTNSISSNYVFSVLKDSKDNIWIGTAGAGINLFNKATGKMNRFEQYENIRFQTVTAIVEDNEGVIWFSSKEGIYNYDYNTNSFKSFESFRGEYHINAVIKDENGFLCFGGSKGLMVFNPKTVVAENVNPDVKLTSFKLYNKEVPIEEEGILQNEISFTKSISLKHNLNVITFDFAAMQFPFSTNCEYAIKLEGFDKDWREIGHERTTTYTNLRHGTYTFKVKSKTSGSTWEDNFTSIQIEIEKPYWLTWWAYVVYALVVILIFYVFRKYIISWEQMKSNLEFERLSHEKDIELYNIKQQFFTNISHELRTPITLIVGVVNKILRERSNSREKESSQVEALEKNSKHLLNLVNELLDYRKLESSEVKIKATEEDIVTFCKETFSAFQEEAKEKNIDFSFICQSSHIHLWFDKIQMDKVLYNLISNAFKFTNPKGTITLQIQDTDDKVVLILKDAGLGISSNKIAKIFDRFYQTEIKNSFKNKGYGLGLSIVKEIIELHQGDICVESEKGKGTKFTIELKKGNEHFSKDDLGGNELNSERIENYYNVESDIKKENIILELTERQKLLIVEDNLEIRRYIKDLLQDEFDVFEAENGKTGLDMAKNIAPDLIISDVMMPEMNGIDLTKALKNNMVTSHIPVMLLTARASVMQQMEGYNTGADEYVTKPFNEQLLRSRIKNLLRNRTLLHEKFRTEEIVPINEISKNDADKEFLKKLGELIHKHIDSDSLNANFISKAMGMSHSVIYKKIKTLTGLTLIQFITDYKLKVAKKLIEYHGVSVTNAGYYIGYSDRKHFRKLFKSRFGVNPSSFLNKK
ncbi:two-component regulator propeller domain-containing protein [Tamlana sp. 2201CG12-4]|uniref:hybrid sensor histidine kinase/response regulator transcription factor n=1 Tax=Tamlana sp. 2201CG12-4 TaxID=3112582 RepID=UPI002DBDA6B5|nr:two-component regulator propeller domain-containing protein [Tamlana sp. 2201CG12-4]MEC3908468.1 two-component regulator propeller domain-containing protein [Tamlana sp. 2201CG12-4]